MKKAIIIGVSLFTIALTVFIVGVSASNKEIRIGSEIAAQKQVCESYFDKMWKVIQQTAQVADQYKTAFKDIYPALIEGRYGNEKGGSLMKWVTESNPTFDISLYKDLTAAIEAERAGFFMEQKKLIDLSNEHRIVLKTFPSSLFVGNRKEIPIKIVSSSTTKKIMETGEENDIELFKK